MYTQQEGKDIYIGEIFEFIQQILDLKNTKNIYFIEVTQVSGIT